MDVDPGLVAEYVTRLQTLNGDLEDKHIDADELLCELLTRLGYGAVVEAYEAINKLYG